MQTVIWAFGSMLVLMLIVFLLPLGYAMKGKFFIVQTAFILALGGLAATVTFPIWQALIMLFALSFFGAYFLDSRYGKLLTNVKGETEDVFEDTAVSVDLIKQNQTDSDLELMDLSEVEITATSSNKLDKDTNVDEIKLVQPILAQENNDIDALEDSSFLQELKLESVKLVEDAELNDGSLSDIEYTLDEIMKETEEEVEAGWLDELAELSVVEGCKEDPAELEEMSEVTFTQDVEEQNIISDIEESSWLDELAELSVVEIEEEKNRGVRDEDDSLDDEFELEELFAVKEVAATLEVKEEKKSPQLQK